MATRIFSVLVCAGLPFGLVVGFLMMAESGRLAVGALAGAVGGFLAGGAGMAIFLELQRRKLMAKDGVFEGALVLHEGPANHLAGAEARGGWLTLTGQALAFRPRGKNVKNEPVTLPLAEVAACHARRMLGIIPNGVVVELKDGTAHHFAVNGNGPWVRRIGEAVKGAPGS